MSKVTDENFEKEVIEASNEKPVVVDFWAAWCGPCQVLGPVIEKVGEDYKDKAKVVKLNVDENKETAQKYSIMSIPSVKLFKNGKVVDEFVGVQPEDAIKSWIDKNL